MPGIRLILTKNINLDYLRTFVLVVEHGSFSAAAERLDISQPAVSLQIRQLERSLGATLIERVGRRTRPTAAGADLLSHAARVESAVAAAVQAVARRAHGPTGRVRLGTGATACIFLLPPLLKDLRQRFPNLEITVATGNTPDIVKSIEENVLDIGLVTMPAAGRALEVTPVLKDEFLLLAPAGMSLPARITAEALSRKPVLLFEPGGNTRRIADEWFGRSGIDLRPVMSLGSVEAIKGLVAAGLGCAILPGMAVPRQAQRHDVVARPLSPRLYRKLAVVIRRDKRLHSGLNEAYRALKGLANPSPADPAIRP
ncbi:LysR family transcriptional regulator [Bordetella bronchialis]|uniref:LysR family transcriptional regulator n=1 Tax=Bordetella bronchialis TaxID=463025 RepID=A0ABM6CTZ3_9BORD|nr:LysR family transcriptional regulator [Bordetella bronchialis]ANN67552.1 LysR family transcriptional regulator [Bordetella bronchialis]